MNLVVGCHYLPPGPWLLFQPKSITSAWPIPNHTAWWQRCTGMDNLPKAVAQQCPTRSWTCDLSIASLMPCLLLHHVSKVVTDITAMTAGFRILYWQPRLLFQFSVAIVENYCYIMLWRQYWPRLVPLCYRDCGRPCSMHHFCLDWTASNAH